MKAFTIVVSFISFAAAVVAAPSPQVPICTFDPVKGEYICSKDVAPQLCKFDPVKGEYVCPPTATVESATLASGDATIVDLAVSKCGQEGLRKCTRERQGSVCEDGYPLKEKGYLDDYLELQRRFSTLTSAQTLTSSNHTLGQSRHLSELLHYFENRLADYKGSSLQGDEVFQRGPVATYFQLLAGLILLAPNVEHICLVSLEHDDVSLWTHFLDMSQGFTIRNSTSKLRHLLAQIHAHGWSTSPDISVSERLIQHLRSFPVLQDLRISGAITHRPGTLPLVSSKTLNLCRLDLIENSLDIDDVADLVLACKGLRHFTCKWALYNDVYVDPSILQDALLAHADTLETLSIDWREVGFSLRRDANALRSVKISDLGFLSAGRSLLDLQGEVLDPPISSLLPESLQQMTILTEASEEFFYGRVLDLDEAVCLWQLARDCKASLPAFKTLCVRAACELPVLTLAHAFEQAGVRLHVQKETLG
ncbi:uncharacterized protein M421DRAFT_395659 [Didymella exigua CBS 183.55]|uniref:Uncharacterized protein n=1 Tax=Didymella exigua CBS 183.55 TaxID=1150837 RepID=A0A6A5RYV8_9PLEO|nr:uncharacterized protein M421DRAFT_395659 [Didymella exigua CBS 183.55]KAF1933581.1 hypothetical protein M421DRAFT_395659 [Didymella exigua CBS 183.55]